MTDQQEGVESESEPLATARSLNHRIGSVAGASAIALVFGQVITLAQTVALARLLTPGEVGLFAAGTVLTTFLGNFVEGGLRSGLVHREDNLPDAAETAFWATTISGFLMALAALAASPVVGIVFHSPQAGLVAAVSSGLPFLFAFTNVPEALLQREFNVRRRLIVGPSVGVSYAIVAVVLAMLGWGVWSMVAGMYASYFVWVATVWLISGWRPGRGRASVTVWRQLSRYGFPLVLGMIGARIQTMVESVVVGRGLSSAALGQYRYGRRIATIPGQAIIEVGAIALFPAFSRISAEPTRLKPAFLRALRWATTGAAALTGLMLALGIPAVVVVFGSPWRAAGLVVVAMAGLGLGKALISVSEEAIKGGGRTELLNWYTLTEVGLGIILPLVLIWPLGLVGVGLAVSVTALVVGVVCLWLARKVVGFSLGEVCAAVLPQLPCAAVATVVCWALEQFVLHSDSRSIPVGVLFLVFDVVIFASVYLGALTLIVPSTTRDLLRASRVVLRRLRRR